MMEHSDVTATMRGSMTALVTPFRGGEIDWPCVDKLIDRQIEGGTDWLVPLGTTGESPTLTRAERDKLLDAVIARTAGRCPVMAGTGSNNTAEAVNRTKQAASAGANAALVVAPSYNRPTPEGLFRHFAKVAESVDLPIVLYNVPARTGVNVDNDVVVRLFEDFTNIIAIKDATGNVDKVTDLHGRCDIAVLSGDDSLTWPLMALGAVGVVSVIANQAPPLMKSLVTAALAGNASDALQIHRKVYDLAVGIGRYGPNPLPIKTAMAINGLIEEEFRLPLCPLDADSRAGIERVLRRHEMLETSAT
ncbi:MAG: 4-hydroxy-tetrahydrodipicolinate synthase [Phycisphaerales bacterium]|nr:MAG: 4-hydroxy-tetrahydrodipicolinate synthase [Phycisphaerales bacterium]